MAIAHCILEIDTEPGICIYNITAKIQALLETTSIQIGHVLIVSRHTTTALAINEDEARLLEDIKTWLKKLAPPAEPYLHNDLHLRPDIPADEPMNAHAHLMAMLLNHSEMLPVIDGKLALGTYQSILLFELDGPRKRTVLCQVSGE